ncbi:MAG: chromate transporter [Anaerovoracaceae bacterium]
MKLIEKIKNNMLIQLFCTFFKLGIFTIGGGMAMIPLMQNIVVDKKGWMNEEEIVDCLAVSQGLPGVIAINMATYVGNQKKGIWGSIVATIGVILPSFIIIILVVEFLQTMGDNKYIAGALVGIKASATGLIAFSAYKVGKQVLTGGFQWVMAILAFTAVVFLKVNAVWTIIVGIAAGIIYTWYRDKAKKGGRENDLP